jgi:hypothetical protein
MDDLLWRNSLRLKPIWRNRGKHAAARRFRVSVPPQCRDRDQSAMPTNDPFRRRTPFLLWSWAMLLVVLLSAAPTGGAPRTQVVGSAFDPATVSVALNPKSPKAKAAIVVAGGGLPDVGLDSPPALAAAAAAYGRDEFANAGGAVVAVPVARPVGPHAFVRAHGARAPPTA